MLIRHLADCPDLLPGLASELFGYYRDLIPGDTLADRVTKLERHLNRETLPVAWVAIERDSVLGTASLRGRDLDGWDHLTPWLGGVYVTPAERRKGVGAALCRTIEDAARARDFDRIFLFTTNRQAWYASMGWRSLADATWRDHPGHVMEKALHTPEGRTALALPP